MEEMKDCEIRDRGFLLSGAAGHYLGIVYVVLLLAHVLVMAPIMLFFPAVAEIKWLAEIPMIITGCIFLIYMLGLLYTVTMKNSCVILKWFGIPFRCIPVSRFKMFCAVGNGREDVLCLSPYSVDEMAEKQERRFRKSFLHKHNITRYKHKSGWKDDFSRQYLNHLRKNLFGMLKERNVIMLRMHPSLQYAIQKMYPQLPYMNYTGLTEYKAKKHSGFSENQAVCFRTQAQEYEAHIEADGIYVRNFHEEILFIPAQQIKTAVQVDVFSGYRKFYPHHIPVLYITSLSEEELASHAFSRGKGVFRVNLPFDQAHMAMTAASCLAQYWTTNEKNACVLYHTEKNLLSIQTLYKHVRINTVSENWLENTDCSER